MILLGFITIIIFSIWFGKKDRDEIRNGVWINYKERYFIRGSIIFLISVIASKGILLSIPFLFLSYALCFWIVFDISINLYLGRRPLQRGKTSDLDKFLGEFKTEEKAFIFKLGIFVLSLIQLIFFDKLYKPKNNHL